MGTWKLGISHVRLGDCPFKGREPRGMWVRAGSFGSPEGVSQVSSWYAESSLSSAKEDETGPWFVGERQSWQGSEMGMGMVTVGPQCSWKGRQH